jgi:hypothetical protein
MHPQTRTAQASPRAVTRLASLQSGRVARSSSATSLLLGSLPEGHWRVRPSERHGTSVRPHHADGVSSSPAGRATIAALIGERALGVPWLRAALTTPGPFCIRVGWYRAASLKDGAMHLHRITDDPFEIYKMPKSLVPNGTNLGPYAAV